MKASQIRALANIADKPGASVSTQLIAMRRVCRLFCHERATIHQERHALRRKAAKLRAFLPFTAATVADLEQQAREHEAESLEGMSRALIGIGRAVILQSASTTAALGFDRLCDLLSVNYALSRALFTHYPVSGKHPMKAGLVTSTRARPEG